MAQNRTLTINWIIFIAFAALIIAHLLLKAHMPNSAFGGIGFMLIALLFSYVLMIKRDVFGFILIIYICSHFSYADNQGGLWNLMAFGMLILHKIMGGKTKEFRRKDAVMTTLIGVFVLLNVVGWVLKNPMPLIPKMQGAAIFISFILVYSLTSNLIISKERFRKFFFVTLFMLIYQLVIALNQRYQFLAWNTPLLGGYTDSGTSILPGVVNTPGTIGHFELFAEYAVLMLCLLVPLLSSSSTQRDLRFSPNTLVLMIFICLIIPMMTSTRSAAILSVFIMLFYFVLFPMGLFSGIDRFGRQLRIILVVSLLLPVVGVYVGMKHLEQDLSTIDSENFTAESVVSGGSLNRGGTTSMALKRIDSNSWWVGYGLGIPRSNRWAWFGVDPAVQELKIADFHSLYLSVPMLYGWAGSLIFFAIIVITQFRAAKTALQYNNQKGFLAVLVVGISVFWIVFMIDQYKISILRNPGYHMLFWVWLGLTHAIIKTLRNTNDAGNVAKKTSKRILT